MKVGNTYDRSQRSIIETETVRLSHKTIDTVAGAFNPVEVHSVCCVWGEVYYPGAHL